MAHNLQFSSAPVSKWHPLANDIIVIGDHGGW